ncbi:MAG: outer membrane beta-barrel protein [Acidobacteria bacterium]|nr:outer membrane beta-barrel protein [Acidobacteriota bacterium]
MRSCKCFVVIVSLAILTLAAPLGADEPRPERAPQQSETQPNETQPNETEALREEVRELRERLARLEGLLGRVVARASDADALPALAADPDLTPGEARFMNASQPAALPPYSVAGAAAPAPAAVPAPAPQAVVELPAGVASTGGQPLAITGLLDTYYTRNFNNPADGTNTLYYTNPNSRGFGLNQAKLEIDAKGKGPVGFRSDIWFGSGARLFREGLEPGRLEDVLYLQQA